MQLHDHVLLQPDGGTDSAYYVHLARGLLTGDTAAARAFFVAPLYVYSLAGGLAVLRSELAVRVLQIALGTAAVWLIQRTAPAWFGPRAALIAAALAAGTGLFTFNEILLLHSALDYLTALVLYTVTRAAITRNGRWFLAAGLAIGLHALNRPNVMVYAAVVGAGVLLTRRTREGVRHAAAYACGVALALAPITVRNYARTGELVIISSHGGLNFYIGNNPGAGHGPVRRGGGDHALDCRAGRRRPANRVPSAWTRGRRGRDLARLLPAGSGLDAAPPWYPPLASGYQRRRWSSTPQSSRWTTATPSTSAMKRCCCRCWGSGRGCLLHWVSSGCSHDADISPKGGYWLWAAFVPVYARSPWWRSSRRRDIALPFRAPLAVGAGAAIDSGDGVVAQTGAADARVRGPRRCGARNRGEPRQRAGRRALGGSGPRGRWRRSIGGRVAEAEHAIARFEPRQPAPALLHARAGQAFQQQARYHAAIAHFTRALALDPAQPAIDFALGQAFLDTGRFADAIPHLRRAYDAGIRSDVAGFSLARALAASGQAVEAGRVLESRSAREGDAASLTARADLALAVNRPDFARVFLHDAAAQAPEDAGLRQRYGLALAVAGDIRGALDQLEAAVRLDPDRRGRAPQCRRAGTRRLAEPPRPQLRPGRRCA